MDRKKFNLLQRKRDLNQFSKVSQSLKVLGTLDILLFKLKKAIFLSIYRLFHGNLRFVFENKVLFFILRINDISHSLVAFGTGILLHSNKYSYYAKG